MRGVAVVALGALVLATGSGANARQVEGTTAKVGPAHLIFTSDRDGDFDVYGASADGRRIAALTRNSTSDTGVILSPAGGWLALTRSHLHGVLVRADGRSERMLRATAVTFPTPVAFSPDGRWLAIERENLVDENEYINLWRVGTGRIRRLGVGRPFAFSPDGRLLAFEGDSSDGLIDLATGRRRTLPDDDAGHSVLFSPKWKRIAYETGQDDDGMSDLVVRDVAHAGSRRQIVAHGVLGSDEVWLNDDRLAFTAYIDGLWELRVFDVAGGSSRTIAKDAPSPTWSPARDRLAYVPRSFSEDVSVVIAGATGAITNTIRVGRSVEGLAWSPSGRRLAIVSWYEPWSGVLIADPDGFAEAVQIDTRIRPPGEVRWSPDGSALAVNAGDVLVVPAGGGQVRRVTKGGNNTIIGWMRGPLPANAPRPAPPPPAELAGTGAIKSRGKVVEIASDKGWAAAVLDASPIDCWHVVAWSPEQRSLVRFSIVARCEYSHAYFGLSLVGSHIEWTSFYCGNYCYVMPYTADIRVPGEQRGGEERGADENQGPTHPPAPHEPRRGVSVSLERRTIVLRRLADGAVRRIRPPGGAVDAELEDVGLYYAYNTRGPWQGHVVFVPFARLFG